MRPPESPEVELLFSVLRQGTGRQVSRAWIESLERDGLDWDDAIALVKRHGLGPQLYKLLGAGDEPLTDDRQLLQNQYRANAAKNLQYSQRMHELSRLFQRHDVRAVPYKGPILAEYAYENVGDRLFGDIDFLIAKDDVTRARELLQARGYEQQNYADVPVETLLEFSVFRWGKELRFLDSNVGVPVELRFEFIGGKRTDSRVLQDIWNRRTELSLAGKPITALDPADRALLLLAHGTKHGWRRLSWVYDIARLLQRDIEWETVLDRAKSYGWWNAILFGLAVAAELADADLPRCATHELSQYHRHRSAAVVLSKLLHHSPDMALDRLEPLSTVLFLNDTATGAVNEALDVVFSPRKVDYDWVSLPPSLYHLYYVVRPCRVGISAFTGLLRSVNVSLSGRT